jgi:cell division protease FtsH
MVMRFGMSEKLGPRVFGHDHGQPFLGREIARPDEYSRSVARNIDDEIQDLLDEALDRARGILLERREHLESLSETLARRETIERDEFLALLGGTT